MYVSNFGNKIITENVRKLAWWISSKKVFSRPLSHLQTLKSCLLEELLAVLSTEKSGLGFMNNGGDTMFCSRVYLFVNS